jgi:hypothetical protein
MDIIPTADGGFLFTWSGPHLYQEVFLSMHTTFLQCERGMFIRLSTPASQGTIRIDRTLSKLVAQYGTIEMLHITVIAGATVANISMFYQNLDRYRAHLFTYEMAGLKQRMGEQARVFYETYLEPPKVKTATTVTTNGHGDTRASLMRCLLANMAFIGILLGWSLRNHHLLKQPEQRKRALRRVARLRRSRKKPTSAAKLGKLVASRRKALRKKTPQKRRPLLAMRTT